MVVPALGTLHCCKKEKSRRDYPVFDYQWVPRYLAERGASKIRVWLKVIAELAENAEVFVDACDFDVEGSIIGYCILKYACGGKQETCQTHEIFHFNKRGTSRIIFQMMPHLDFALVEAGLADMK